jgi:L-rhamnose mutarotase
MQGFGVTLRLKPGAAESYKAYHRAVWPEVLETISECNIRNYSIYFKDDFLFSYLEYHGSDIKADWAKMAAQNSGVVGCDGAPPGTACDQKRRRIVGRHGRGIPFGLKSPLQCPMSFCAGLRRFYPASYPV